MTSLRQKMIYELELHRKSEATVKAYVAAVAQLAKHYRRSPDLLSVEQIRDFLHHEITVRKLAFSTVNQKLAGIRFFYHEVLGQETFRLKVPAKRSGRRSAAGDSAVDGARPLEHDVQVSARDQPALGESAQPAGAVASAEAWGTVGVSTMSSAAHPGAAPTAACGGCELADVFARYGDAYLRGRRLRPARYKAVLAKPQRRRCCSSAARRLAARSALRWCCTRGISSCAPTFTCML